MSLALLHNTMSANEAAKTSTEQLHWASDGCQTINSGVHTMRKHYEQAQCCKVLSVVSSGPPTTSPVTEMPACVSEASFLVCSKGKHTAKTVYQKLESSIAIMNTFFVQ